MNIIIIGAGTVGFSLAEHLRYHNHAITIIDSDERLCSEINNRLDVFTLAGKGSNPRILEAAGIARADMVIAVTPNDDTNILACAIARQYGISQRIARVKSGEFTGEGLTIDLEALGVTHLVEPEKEVVRSILQYIELPGVTETANFQSDNVYLRGYVISADMPIANKTLFEITNSSSDSSPMLIVVLIRNGESIIPKGREYVLPGDEIITIMPRKSFPAFRTLINHPAGRLKKIVVSGDTLTAVHLAHALKSFSDRIILADPDETHGMQAAEHLNKVEVLSGDCTEADLLQDIHIETADFFIAAGKDTEDNVMSCLLAKAEGAKKVIAVNNSDRHAQLFQSLGLDTIINPRKITAQTIISSILRIPIHAHLGLHKVNIEVIRLVAQRKSKIVGKPLRKLDILHRKSIIIGAIMRGDDVLIPQGETMIKENDEVLVLCKRESADFVKRLFRVDTPIPV